MYVINLSKQTNKYIKNNIMKKIIFTMIFSLMLCLSVNANENNTMNTEAYSMNVNTEVLSKTLNASKDQSECINDIMNMLSIQMENIKYETVNTTREKMLTNTINMNTNYMKQVLNDNQYKKYLMILNATLKNRGLR